MQKKNIARAENFGYTLLDRRSLMHRFIHKEEPDPNGYEVWSADLSNAPKDLLFSPVRMYFEVTNICNLRCKTCFNNSGQKRPDEMNTEQVLRTLDGFRRNNVMDIRFTGGEVTCRPDWFEILRHAKDLGFAVSINTNGVYRNDETPENLASLELEQITLSVDGDRQSHDMIRGDGNYERTVSSMQRLHDLGAHLRINTILTRSSAESIPHILDLASRYAEEINFFYMRLMGRALNLSDQIVPYEDLCRIDEKIDGLRSRYPGLNILHGSKVMARTSVNADLSKKFGLTIGGPEGFTRFNILPDGSLWPGGYTPHIRPEFMLGNIISEGYDLLNIWRHSEKLASYRKISLELQKTCSECDQRATRCNGASMEMTFFKEKNPHIGNPYCAK
ncbi:radical SAM protein [Candidatus Woesearchaeota archaeon]|nr:radical SAM protein [Candidatus Woesearchaeota archaeon]